MNWERIESARTRARFLLAIPWLVIAFLVAVPMGTPSASSGPRVEAPPISELLLAVGVAGVVVGYLCMWRIYCAPTRFEGAHWRFHDH